jgi:hypothetical protein
MTIAVHARCSGETGDRPRNGRVESKVSETCSGSETTVDVHRDDGVEGGGTPLHVY